MTTTPLPPTSAHQSWPGLFSLALARLLPPRSESRTFERSFSAFGMKHVCVCNIR